MNKRTRKKHEWLGAKRAGAIHCKNEIARDIRRRISYSGITPKSNRFNVRRYIHWFFHHSSEERWSNRVDEAFYPRQMFLSAKHLLVLPADYTSFNGRYRPNPPIDEATIQSISKEEK